MYKNAVLLPLNFRMCKNKRLFFWVKIIGRKMCGFVSKVFVCFVAMERALKRFYFLISSFFHIAFGLVFDKKVWISK